MRKSLLFSAVLAGLMLGSCSSSDDLAGGNTPANQSGKGYVAFNINLPSQSGTSTRANDSFDDGTANEYAVQNATLLLFDGVDEASATFKGAFVLSTEPWKNQSPANSNITTKSKTIVQEVKGSFTDAKALVILNHNDVLTVSGTSLSVNGTPFTGNYSQFLNLASATNGKTLTENGFYMANAPLCSEKGGDAIPSTSAKVTTLTDLKGKIYSSEAEAKANPAAEVYVERGVAKVTLHKNTSVTTADNGTATKVAFDVTGWAIDNKNPETYLVRSTDDFDKWYGLHNSAVTTNPYRFVGHDAVATGLYRTYFAKDMNYDADATTLSRVTVTDFNKPVADPQYCFENTFDVDHQNEDQTTLATIKAKLNNGTDFYILGGDQTTLYIKTELEKFVKDKFLSVAKSWLDANQAAGTTIAEGDLTVAFDTEDAGTVKVSNITVEASKLIASPAAYTTEIANVNKAVGEITHYKNGVSYYKVRIKHFGDDLTPWANGVNGVKEGNVYPATPTTGTTEDNWLGRYGVLRNNWYDITVDGVKGLGSATVPEVTTDPDDNLKSYISVKINVLSWAKRTQSATLGE